MPIIYILVFLGFFGGALVSPVLSPMFLHPVEHGVLPDGTSMAQRVFLLGVAMGMMRLGEFFGSPLLGRLSDRHGRRTVLAAAMGITGLGNFAIAWSIGIDQVWLIVLSQFLIGFTGVLLVLAQAEVAHRWSGVEKTRRFGYVYLASSLAYVFAPAIGGHLADRKSFDWASYPLVFVVAGTIYIASVLLVLWRFPAAEPETGTGAESAIIPERRGAIIEFGDAFRMPSFRMLLLVNFFLYLGIDFVFQFNSVFFVQKWSFTSADVGWLMSYTSIAMVATQWFLIRPVGRRLAPRAATTASAIALAVLLGFQVAPDRWQWLIVILPLVGVAMSLATTNMSALLSDTAGEAAQGRMLGVAHSIRVFGS
ncbi:MAG: MFS transporter, partial [Planctomycetia bacterium]|nr:MFS transporter [Planctomycetia bacterium]